MFVQQKSTVECQGPRIGSICLEYRYRFPDVNKGNRKLSLQPQAIVVKLLLRCMIDRYKVAIICKNRRASLHQTVVDEMFNLAVCYVPAQTKRGSKNIYKLQIFLL